MSASDRRHPVLRNGERIDHRSEAVIHPANELREPLAAILAYADLLRSAWSRIDEDGRDQVLVKIIEKAEVQLTAIDRLFGEEISSRRSGLNGSPRSGVRLDRNEP